MSDILEPKFKIGNVVQLASGGQHMTIAQIEGTLNMQTSKFDKWTGYVWCNWFVDTDLKKEKFHQDSLVLVKD